MFLITNRQVDEEKTGPDALGSKPNSNGPNELRLAEADKVDGAWRVSILPDVCTPAMLESAGIKSGTLRPSTTARSGTAKSMPSKAAASSQRPSRPSKRSTSTHPRVR